MAETPWRWHGDCTELAGAVTGATLNDWRPDDTFFDLLNGKDVVNAVLADVWFCRPSPRATRPNLPTCRWPSSGDIMFGQNGRDQNADWLPGYFRFHAT